MAEILVGSLRRKVKNVVYDIQKAGIVRRLSAWLLDTILLCVLAVGCAWVIGAVVDYDGVAAQLDTYYTQYETQYNVDFECLPQDYEAETEDDRLAYQQRYEEAEAALVADQEAMRLYSMTIQLTLIMVSAGILLAVLLLEFVVPMLLRNGQTAGKKIFSLAVVRTNGVKINGVCLFIRSILGKYTIETMICVYMLIMLYFGQIGLLGLITMGALALTQLVLVIVTKNNSVIHDLLADTVVVDMSTQMIFADEAERLAYQQREAAEKAARQTY